MPVHLSEFTCKHTSHRMAARVFFDRVAAASGACAACRWCSATSSNPGQYPETRTDIAAAAWVKMFRQPPETIPNSCGLEAATHSSLLPEKETLQSLQRHDARRSRRLSLHQGLRQATMVRRTRLLHCVRSDWPPYSPCLNAGSLGKNTYFP